MSIYRNIPDDVRRDIADLRMLLDCGVFLPDDNGVERFEAHITGDRARMIEARLEATPRNVVIVQTPTGRYQIEIGETLVVRVLDAHKAIAIMPQSSNAIELRAM